MTALGLPDIVQLGSAMLRIVFVVVVRLSIAFWGSRAIFSSEVAVGH